MSYLKLSFVVGATLGLCACGAATRLPTSSGRPEVKVSRSWLKRVPVAIAGFTMNQGRHLDEAKRDELVTFDGVKGSDGSLEVRSKTIYNFTDCGDSVTLTSRRILTSDLDDEDATEDTDQPSLEEQQAELQQIVDRLAQDIAREASANVARTANTQSGQ
jgi:hypothetical protein